MIDNIIIQRSKHSKGIFRIAKGETDEIDEIYVGMYFVDTLKNANFTDDGNPKNEFNTPRHIMLGFVVSRNEDYIYEHEHAPDLLIEAAALYRLIYDATDPMFIENMAKPYIDMLFRKIIDLDFCDFTEKDLFVAGSPIKLHRIAKILQGVARGGLTGEPVAPATEPLEGDNTSPAANVMLKHYPQSNIVVLTSVAKPNEPQPIFIRTTVSLDLDNKDATSINKYVVVQFWAGVTHDSIGHYLGYFRIGPTDEDDGENGAMQKDINELFDDVMKKLDVYEMSGHAYTKDNFMGQVKASFTDWIGDLIRDCINKIEDDD